MLKNRIAEDPDDPRLLGPLAIAYAALGWREDALEMEARVLEAHDRRPGAAVGYDLRQLAETRLLLGDADKAVEYVERMLNKPSSFSAPAVKRDPTWRELRDNPGFVAMLDRLDG